MPRIRRQSGSGPHDPGQGGSNPGHPVSPGVYAAAVRYQDGRKDFFHVKNATSVADARQVVMDSLLNIRTLLISPRNQRD